MTESTNENGKNEEFPSNLEEVELTNDSVASLQEGTNNSKIEAEMTASNNNQQQAAAAPPVHPAFFDPKYGFNPQQGHGIPPPPQYHQNQHPIPGAHQQNFYNPQMMPPGDDQGAYNPQMHYNNQQIIQQGQGGDNQQYSYNPQMMQQQQQFDFNGQPIYNNDYGPVDGTATTPESPKIELIYCKPTEEQVQNLAKRLRSKYRIYLPFDWLGQGDHDWYGSWFMNQGNFVAFRIGLSLYAFWALMKFQDRFFHETWDCVMDRVLDTTTLIRFPFVWLSLFSVFVGVTGMTVMSLCKLIMPHDTFKKLSSFRASKSSLGKWRDWAVFGMNYHYDAAPIMACMPLVLTVVPVGFFPVKLALPLWPAVTLPVLVFLDTWITKRCRFDGSYIRRYIFVTLGIISAIGMIWTIISAKALRHLFAIFTSQSVYRELTPLALLTLAFAAIATVGTDSLYSFSIFKAHYLLENHFDTISARSIDEIVAENKKHYKIKTDARLARQAEEEAANKALYDAYMAANKAAYDAYMAVNEEQQQAALLAAQPIEQEPEQATLSK